MQLQLDWTQRDRCARMWETSLSQVQVGTAQRAVAVLVFVHPQSVLVERERNVWALRTSYRQAADWLNHKSDLYRNLKVHPTSLHQALRAWQERGVMQAAGRPTVLFLNATALRDWHAGRQFDPAEFAATWTHQQTRVYSRREPSMGVDGCPRPYHSSEGVSEGAFFSTDKENHSLTHSLSQDARLPPLPAEVFDAGCPENRLCASVRAWWVSEGLRDRGHDPDAVLGAILAARHNRVTAPQAYVEGCVRRGVSESWRQRAAALRRRCGSSPSAAVVPSREKTPRVIGIQP